MQSNLRILKSPTQELERTMLKLTKSLRNFRRWLENYLKTSSIERCDWPSFWSPVFFPHPCFVSFSRQRCFIKRIRSC